MFYRLKTIVSASMLAALLASGAAVCSTAMAQETQQVAKAGWYSQIVNVDFVKKIAQGPKVDGAMLIDSRPTARKFNLGHIPSAVNIPDSAFDKLAPTLLPADKAALLVFYCDGPECTLSHSSAFKAEKLGYTNIKVFADGYPAWVAVYGAGPTVAPAAVKSAPVIEAGKEPGSISVASFERIYKEAPDSVHLIDVREPQEFAAGTFKGAVNMPINTLEKNIDKLPTDKPIVFFCGAGGRSGEAHDMAKLYKPELKTVFLDAETKWQKDGSYTLKGH
jgi:rhodanese-related sulfurtransferase